MCQPKLSMKVPLKIKSLSLGPYCNSRWSFMGDMQQIQARMYHGAFKSEGRIVAFMYMRSFIKFWMHPVARTAEVIQAAL